MTRTYAVLQVPALAYMLVRREIAKLPKSDYGHMIDRDGPREPERLMFDAVALEAAERVVAQTQPAGQRRREELARILEIVAKDGLDGPRNLDVALDAILSVFGEEHET